MHTATLSAVIASLAVVLAASAVAAGEPCRSVSGPIDAAFAAPGGCVPTKPAKPAAAAAKGWTTAPNGTRRWTDGDTTLSVSGSVGFDVKTGTATGTPNR